MYKFKKGMKVLHTRWDGEVGIVGKIKGNKAQIRDLYTGNVVGWYSKKNLIPLPVLNRLYTRYKGMKL